MPHEPYYDERDFEDGAVPDDDYQYDPEDDLPDGSIPPLTLEERRAEWQCFVALTKKPYWDYRFD